MFTLPKWHATLAMLLAMAAIGNAAAQTRMRLWVIHPDDYPVTIAARSFASEVGKKSGGRIQIDVIGTDVIRDQAEAQKMLKDGKLEMGEFNLAMLSEAVPSMKALNLPFLFSDSKHMFSLLDGEMGRTFEKRLGEVGFVNLGWYDGGSLSPGMLADFITVDLESTRTAGSKAAEVIYTANASDVLTVVVGGRVVVDEGRHAFGPVAPLIREALTMLREAV